ERAVGARAGRARGRVCPDLPLARRRPSPGAGLRRVTPDPPPSLRGSVPAPGRLLGGPMSSVSRSSVSRRCRRTRRGTRSAGVIGIVLATIVATVVVGTAVLTAPAAGIVGGRATQPGELPFMVSVQSADRTGLAAHFCGGSVLRKRLVLTAAHCVSDRRPQDLRVVVGDHRLDGSVARAHAVDKIRVHPRYAATGTHDVAILRTTTPMRVPRLRIVGARNNAFETN